jgi:hypothetical protein
VNSSSLDEIVPSRIQATSRTTKAHAPPRTSRPDGMNEKRKWHHTPLSRIKPAETPCGTLHCRHTYEETLMESSYLYDATLLSIKVVLLSVSGYRRVEPVDGSALSLNQRRHSTHDLCCGPCRIPSFSAASIKGNRESIHCLTARRGRKKKKNSKSTWI